MFTLYTTRRRCKTAVGKISNVHIEIIAKLPIICALQVLHNRVIFFSTHTTVNSSTNHKAENWFVYFYPLRWLHSSSAMLIVPKWLCDYFWGGNVKVEGGFLAGYHTTTAATSSSLQKEIISFLEMCKILFIALSKVVVGTGKDNIIHICWLTPPRKGSAMC